MTPLEKQKAFAANFAAQMEEGHGRHNSRQDFDGIEQRTGLAIIDAPALEELRDHYRQVLYGITIRGPAARVVGELVVKPRVQDCNLGECAEVTEAFNIPGLRLRIPVPRSGPLFYKPGDEMNPTITVCNWTFERVRALDGRQYWKRIE